MTGPDHYVQAQRLIRRSEEVGMDGHAQLLVAQAQVHAVLAQAAATALAAVHVGAVDSLESERSQWSDVVSGRTSR